MAKRIFQCVSQYTRIGHPEADHLARRMETGCSRINQGRFMKTLVVFDSTYGNTEKVARAIGESIHCPVLRVGDVHAADLAGLDLFIAGSPTHGGWFTPDFQNWWIIFVQL